MENNYNRYFNTVTIWNIIDFIYNKKLLLYTWGLRHKLFVHHNVKEKNKSKNQGRLIIKCHDQPGIVASVSKFLFDHGSNIIESSQYSSDPEGGEFFISIKFHCHDLESKRKLLEEDFQQ